MSDTNTELPNIDVLAVGDTVTDDFIRLFDDQARVDEDETGKRLSMPFGLKVPFESSCVVPGVGNSANAAVNFALLGLRASLVTNLGEDLRGRDTVTTLHKKGVDTRFVKLHPGSKTNYHYVLWYK